MHRHRCEGALGVHMGSLVGFSLFAPMQEVVGCKLLSLLVEPSSGLGGRPRSATSRGLISGFIGGLR